MSEKLIIILSGIKVRKFDFLRFDVEEFKSQLKYNVQFHELIDYVYPGFSEVFTNTFQSENIKKFSNYEDWKNNITLLKKKFGKNILIINQIDNKNFKSIKINYLIKKLGIKSIFFSNIDHPLEK